MEPNAETLLFIPIANIRESEVALRAVNKESEEYQGLVDSVKAQGILNPIVVRPAAGVEGKYDLIDGLHRFSAAKDVGLDSIPSHVKALNDGEVLVAQIMGNVHKVETKPVQYSRQLVRLMAMNPTLTLGQLATSLAKSTTWVNDRLRLATNLNPKIAGFVDNGEMPLNHAYALAKLPQDEQEHYVDQAMQMPTNEFLPTIEARSREIAKARREGRDPKPQEFAPIAVLKKIKDIQEVINDGNAQESIMTANKVKNKEQAFTAALNWALTLDAGGRELQAQKHQERMAAKEAAKKQRQADRDKAKADAAARATETVSA
jgi:ParB/RepB/Spo0J family partition protein